MTRTIAALTILLALTGCPLPRPVTFHVDTTYTQN